MQSREKETLQDTMEWNKNIIHPRKLIVAVGTIRLPLMGFGSGSSCSDVWVGTLLARVAVEWVCDSIRCGPNRIGSG